jgi:DEAD/DEAH box helicase domain-containing protein
LSKDGEGHLYVMHYNAYQEAGLANQLSGQLGIQNIPIINLSAIVVRGGPRILASAFSECKSDASATKQVAGEPSIAENIVAWETIPAQPARTVPLPEGMHSALVAAALSRGIQSLYTHQNRAWQEILSKRNIVLSTGTASGKSLAYNLPVINRLLDDSNARALYIFPTKALAQDQLASLNEIAGHLPAMAVTMGIHRRASGLRSGQCLPLISNPDMLHTVFCPTACWADFFQNHSLCDRRATYLLGVSIPCRQCHPTAKTNHKIYGSSLVLSHFATIANPIDLANG